MDADCDSMKIAVNIVNQARPNSAEKHVMALYSECSDRQFNITQIMGFLNAELKKFDMKVKCCDQLCRFLLCADTKQIWIQLGMPTSPGKHPCPFCSIIDSDMQIPLCFRGLTPDA